MSEPNAGSDVVSMKLKAEKKGESSLDLEAEMGRGTDFLRLRKQSLGGHRCWVSRTGSQLGSFLLSSRSVDNWLR